MGFRISNSNKSTKNNKGIKMIERVYNDEQFAKLFEYVLSLMLASNISEYSHKPSKLSFTLKINITHTNEFVNHQVVKNCADTNLKLVQDNLNYLIDDLGNIFMRHGFTRLEDNKDELTLNVNTHVMFNQNNQTIH